MKVQNIHCTGKKIIRILIEQCWVQLNFYIHETELFNKQLFQCAIDLFIFWPKLNFYVKISKCQLFQFLVTAFRNKESILVTKRKYQFDQSLWIQYVVSGALSILELLECADQSVSKIS
ncbi:hypothetical protein FGO68_gene12487 [Halteria grandinella]|uniref:Uncharacterized protein n=1 Tax=Halteria grandinella TaxID=5974 RepID=A0A8J8NEL3_HALGN|nr:hypothetical protein FGO68_gene12487 [Halteria grandinella]